MSFSVSAAGHIPASVPDGQGGTVTQDQTAVEVELYEALKGVLSDPKYGVSNSSFGGSHVTGSLHVPDDPSS